MKTFRYIALIAVAAAVCACAPQKRVIYFQDVENNAAVQTAADNQVRIRPHDRLTIVVSSQDPELAAPFNSASSYNSLSSNPAGYNSSNGINSLQVRTVESDGKLYMPIIGNIYCEGKTREELAAEIAEMIRKGGYINDAVVNIQFADMKISVLGEVVRPGHFDIKRDKISVLEALAMAGDMTIYGNRANVSVVRNENGESKIYKLNLLQSDSFSSPAFYLQSNDVVYVQPNRYKAATAEINQNRSFWISITSTLISAATLILSIISLSKKG